MNLLIAPPTYRDAELFGPELLAAIRTVDLGTWIGILLVVLMLRFGGLDVECVLHSFVEYG